MTRRQEYQRYLQSDAWQALREAALLRAKGKCEYCDAPATQVHHVRYPKQFKHDGLHNLVATCETHHRLSHGIRDNTMTRTEIDQLQQTQFQYVGHGETYPLNVVFLDEAPCFSFQQVARTIIKDEIAFCDAQGIARPDSGGVMQLLKMRAQTELQDADLRHIDESLTLIRVSAFFEVCMATTLNVVKPFRRQASMWLEQNYVRHQQALAPAQQAAVQTGGALEHLKAIVSAIEEQQQQIAQADHKSDKALAISEANRQMVAEVKSAVDDLTERDWMIAETYLTANGEHINSKTFGDFLWKNCKEAGGYNRRGIGWFLPNGIQVSKKVPAPGTMYSELNAWHVPYMQSALERFKQLHGHH